jgi:hypothetical protein
MLNISTIKKLLRSLNDELKAMDVVGEIGLCGGAVMCLVFQARKATKDIDGIFEPSSKIREAAKKVARKFAIPDNWLNDAAKSYFHVDPPKEDVLEWPNLRIWAPRADYMLAMKCISARFDSHDKDDIVFLLKYLNLKNKDKVFSLIEKYYPKSRIPSKTQFFIEELIEG